MPPPSFQWKKNGVEIDGAAGRQREYVVERAQQGDSGTYTCAVVNVGGQVEWEEALLMVAEEGAGGEGGGARGGGVLFVGAFGKGGGFCLVGGAGREKQGREGKRREKREEERRGE
jgi:hypothetical protein